MWGKPYDMKKIANDEDIEDTCFVVPPPLDCKVTSLIIRCFMFILFFGGFILSVWFINLKSLFKTSI